MSQKDIEDLKLQIKHLEIKREKEKLKKEISKLKKNKPPTPLALKIFKFVLITIITIIVLITTSIIMQENKRYIIQHSINKTLGY